MKKLLCALMFICALVPCLASCDMAEYREAKRLIRELEYKFVYIPYDLSEKVIEILEELFAPDGW